MGVKDKLYFESCIMQLYAFLLISKLFAQMDKLCTWTVSDFFGLLTDVCEMSAG